MIYLIGGTHDGANLCKWLDEKGLDYFMSVATELGKSTYEKAAKRLVVGRLDQDSMGELIRNEGVNWVIDASHPHALEVSQTAIEVCKTHHIRYTRWLREEIVYDQSQVMLAESFEAAFESLTQTTGNVLITGSKELEKAARVLHKNRIVARVVPNSESIVICEKLGLDAGQVIGIKGPFTDEMNQAIFKAWDIRHIVFKESGVGSGFEEKIKAAIACGVNPVVIQMPSMCYPETARNLVELEAIHINIISNGGAIPNAT
jgi:precorrin-6A/cobalt-precorrin-6A reductase